MNHRSGPLEIEVPCLPLITQLS